MSHKFTLRQLELFVAAAQAGQISAASVAQNISQSAMTVAIGNLERTLDARLFDRTRDGVTLTHQGGVFLQRAKSVLDTASETSRFPFHERTDIVGQLEVAATYMVLGYFLLPTLARFRKMFPKVDAVPVERERGQVESQLLSGELSVAVVILSNLERVERFETLSLMKSRRQLWVAHDNELAGHSAAHLHDIANYPYVVPFVDDGEVNVRRHWSRAQQQPKQWLRTSSLEATREMVAVGLGVTILADMLFRAWSLDGRRIHAVPLADPLPELDIGLVWAKGRRMDACTQVFCDFLATSLSNAGGRLS